MKTDFREKWRGNQHTYKKLPLSILSTILVDEQFYENKEKGIINTNLQAPRYLHSRDFFFTEALKN